ncbi:MAG: glycosyltransferase family 4 protein [Crocinitomicaceae bacterium]|nr:glycosyltransferase family 4 protein [Crocinitomicaceae bacterium]
MHIAILTDGIYPYVIGGMQKHSYYLAKFLAGRDHEITLIHTIPAGKPVPSEEEVKAALGESGNNRIHVIGIPFPAAGWLPGHYLKESYRYSTLVYGKIREQLPSFDFIYAKGFAGWHLLHLREKGMKTPPVGVKFHGYEMFQKAADFRSLLEHLLLRGAVKWITLRADVVFSYGGKITGIIQRLGADPKKIIEIPTGIEAEWIVDEVPEQRGPINFAFVGRYERRKGIVELSEILKAADLPGTFHFVGPVPPSKKIQKERIIYHGALNDKDLIRAVLDQCQVLVVPSWSEGMPNVILEGMSRGLAILATDVGAVSQIVDSENGWLVAAGDKNMLLKQLKVIGDIAPSELMKLRRHSVSRVKESFTWESVAILVENSILKFRKA